MTGYSGYTESAEKIEARKRRILKGYKHPGRALLEEVVLIWIAAEAVALALQISLPLLFGAR